MDKDSKIIFSVVLVLLVAMVSFNFVNGNEITGNQVRLPTFTLGNSACIFLDGQYVANQAQKSILANSNAGDICQKMLSNRYKPAAYQIKYYKASFSDASCSNAVMEQEWSEVIIPQALAGKFGGNTPRLQDDYIYQQCAPAANPSVTWLSYARTESWRLTGVLCCTK